MFKYILILMLIVAGSFGAGIVSPALCFMILVASAVISIIMIFVLLINGRTPLLNFWTLIAISTLFAAATASQLGAHETNFAIALTIILVGVVITAVNAARKIVLAGTAR